MVTTNHKRKSKCERMLRFALGVVEQEPTIGPTTFHTRYTEHPTLSMTKHGVYEMRFRTAVHYVAIAKMIHRASKANAKVCILSGDDLNKLIASGTLLQNVADNLNRTAIDELLYILKNIADHLPHWRREDIDQYVKTELAALEDTKYTPEQRHEHNMLRDTVAKPYLYQIGCKFVALEPRLERHSKHRSGLIPDAVGWHENGTIIGVEVKTSASDCFAALTAVRLDRYARYCNQLYILITDVNVYRELSDWVKESIHDEIGILLCDTETLTIIDCLPPRSTQKEPTDSMLQTMRKIYIDDIKRTIRSINLGTDDKTPVLAHEKLMSALSVSNLGMQS